METAAACPVCLQRFDVPSAFALHVASCTMSALPEPAAPGASVAAPTASCPMCHMVYTSALAAHEIEFHEEECERFNEEGEPLTLVGVDLNTINGAASGAATAPSSGAKRTRESTDASATNATAATPSVKLFPSFCAVCDGGGRTLLHCAGKCARSFHPLCIEEINLTKDFAASGSVRAPVSASSSTGSSVSSSLLSAGGSAFFASAITRDKKAQKQWVCGECTRGLHTCQLCGFLGHESHELLPCSLPDCGFFFHAKCLQSQNHRMQSPLVCPRHTCDVCHAMETDISACSSCTKCCKSVHIRCRETPAPATQTRTRGDVIDVNFHVCDDHKPTSDAASPNLTEERKLAQFVGLKMNSRPGDVVLILEYGNLLLPSTAKEAAPAAYNQWGVVQRVENLGDGISPAWWTQLLIVMLFSDDSTISVANRYVLPLSAMKLYTSPTLMIRDAIQWYAMSEANLRYLEQPQQHDAATAIVTASQAAIFQSVEQAFRARMDALDVSATNFGADAMRGFTAWHIYLHSTSRSYAETKAPVYIALDTRGRSRSNTGVVIASERTQVSTFERSQGDEDVDMDGSGSNSNQARGTTTSSTMTAKGSGSVPFRSASATSGAPVEGDVLDVMADLLRGVEALFSVERSIEDVTSPLSDDEGQLEDENVDGIESSVGFAQEGRLSIDAFLNPTSTDNCAMSPAATPSSAAPQIQAAINRIDLMPSKKRVLEEKTGERKVVNVLDFTGIGDSTKGDDTRLPKKMKLLHFPVPIHVQFTVEPVLPKKPSGSTFSSLPLPTAPTVVSRMSDDQRQKKVEQQALRKIVDRYLDAEEAGTLPARSSPNVRPTFYRPAPFLYRGPSVGHGVDSVSRALLCQDKRSLKCYVRQAESIPVGSVYACPSKTNAHNVEYITVDLLAVTSLKMLQREVCDQIWSELPRNNRSTGWHWQPLLAKERDVPLPTIKLAYCTYDGVEHTIPSDLKPTNHRGDLPQHHQPEWLCFCANVVHLTATVVHAKEE